MEHPDMHDVFQLYQNQIALLSSAQRDKLLDAFEEGMSPFVIGCAILRAKKEQRLCEEKGQPKRITFNYVWRIIEDWMIHGIVSEEAFKAYWQMERNEDKDRSLRRSSNAQNGQRKVTRDDFTYKQPAPPKKGVFSFLDD